MGHNVSSLDGGESVPGMKEQMTQAVALAQEMGHGLSGASRQVTEAVGGVSLYLDGVSKLVAEPCCEQDMNCCVAHVEILGKAPPTSLNMVERKDNPRTAANDRNGEVISITLHRTAEQNLLGLDLEFVPEREVMPVRDVTGHLAKEWNDDHPESQVLPGDRVIDVNGTHGTADMMMKEIKSSEIVRITLVRLDLDDGQVTDDWEFVRAFYDRMDWEENMPPRLYELVPYQGDQVVGAGFGDAVTGQIRSAGTVIPWGSAAMTALPVKSILADVVAYQPKLEPKPRAVAVRDPRFPNGRDVGVIGFHCPDQEEAWDVLCGSSFLANFYDLGLSSMLLEAPCEPGMKKPFQNAHAAFQALRFWPLADEFASLSGTAAFQKRWTLAAKEDPSLAGFGSDWNGMLAVLRAKFQAQTPWAAALSKTGDAFLLEHHPAPGRDNVWSDGCTGEGANWLGLQQMLIRDQLSGDSRWTEYIGSLIDLDSGKPHTHAKEQQWQDTVRSATRALVDEVGRRQLMGSLQADRIFGGVACKGGDSFAALDMPDSAQDTPSTCSGAPSGQESGMSGMQGSGFAEQGRTYRGEAAGPRERGPAIGSWV